MTPAFERWLREHVTSADRRAALAEAADGLVDMYNAERSELEDVLTISAWPAFARNRFLRAWQALRDAGRAAALAADEGTVELVLPAGPGNPPTVATVATQTPGVIMAPARPASAAARAALKRRDRNHRGGPSLGPRDARGCFPCPAGCPRTFAHAPAAVQHGKSCQNGTRPPGSAPPQKRPAAPRAPRVPRAPQPPRERQFACERDKCVALICEAARDKLDPALRARPDDGSGRRTKAAWEALLAKYDPTPLASCVHTLGQLARYYSTHARRVDLLEGWRQGLTKWEKMMNSMAVWVLKMIVEEGDRADFLADVIGYILICWCDSAAPRRRRGR